jgi:hypothetical protein
VVGRLANLDLADMTTDQLPTEAGAPALPDRLTGADLASSRPAPPRCSTGG